MKIFWGCLFLVLGLRVQALAEGVQICEDLMTLAQSFTSTSDKGNEGSTRLIVFMVEKGFLTVNDLDRFLKSDLDWVVVADAINRISSPQYRGNLKKIMKIVSAENLDKAYLGSLVRELLEKKGVSQGHREYSKKETSKIFLAIPTGEKFDGDIAHMFANSKGEIFRVTTGDEKISPLDQKTSYAIWSPGAKDPLALPGLTNPPIFFEDRKGLIWVLSQTGHQVLLHQLPNGKIEFKLTSEALAIEKLRGFWIDELFENEKGEIKVLGRLQADKKMAVFAYNFATKEQKIFGHEDAPSDWFLTSGKDIFFVLKEGPKENPRGSLYRNDTGHLITKLTGAELQSGEVLNSGYRRPRQLLTADGRFFLLIHNGEDFFVLDMQTGQRHYLQTGRFLKGRPHSVHFFENSQGKITVFFQDFVMNEGAGDVWRLEMGDGHPFKKVKTPYQQQFVNFRTVKSGSKEFTILSPAQVEGLPLVVVETGQPESFEVALPPNISHFRIAFSLPDGSIRGVFMNNEGVQEVVSLYGEVKP